MKRRTNWFALTFTSLTVAVVVGVFLASISSPWPEVDKPPVEANRAVHPEGFSIVKPGDTRAVVSGDRLTILPDGGRSRYNPVMSVRRLPDQTEDAELRRDGFHDGKFQERAALIYVGESGKYNAWRAVTKRGGRRYEIEMLMPYVEPNWTPPAQWMQYLNTFSAPEPAPAE